MKLSFTRREIRQKSEDNIKGMLRKKASGCALNSADLKEELMVESSESNNAWSSSLASAHWMIYV